MERRIKEKGRKEGEEEAQEEKGQSKREGGRWAEIKIITS